MEDVEAVVREFEELTRQIRRHKEGQRAAAIRRREIILGLRTQGMNDTQIGQLLGLSRSRIERIRAARDIGAS